MVNGICYSDLDRAFDQYVASIPKYINISGTDTWTNFAVANIGSISPTGLLTFRYYLGTSSTLRTQTQQLESCTNESFDQYSFNELFVSTAFVFFFFFAFIVGMRVWR